MVSCTTGPTPAPERTNRGIADYIRMTIIHEGLELEEIGIELAEITDDVHLFGDDGLNLDSIDALEVLAGVQREFGLSFPDVDRAFMTEHCSTVGRLARLVESMSVDPPERGRAADAGADSPAAGAGLGDPMPSATARDRSPSAGVEERSEIASAQPRAPRGGRNA